MFRGDGRRVCESWKVQNASGACVRSGACVNVGILRTDLKWIRGTCENVEMQNGLEERWNTQNGSEIDSRSV